MDSGSRRHACLTGPMSSIQRAVIIVVDSCGVGAAPDAADYGDEGTDTVGHVAAAVGGLTLPNLGAAGLGNLHGSIEGVPSTDAPSIKISSGPIGGFAEPRAGPRRSSS